MSLNPAAHLHVAGRKGKKRRKDEEQRGRERKREFCEDSSNGRPVNTCNVVILLPQIFLLRRDDKCVYEPQPHIKAAASLLPPSFFCTRETGMFPFLQRGLEVPEAGSLQRSLTPLLEPENIWKRYHGRNFNVENTMNNGSKMKCISFYIPAQLIHQTRGSGIKAHV